MAQRGLAPIVLSRRVDLHPQAAWLFAAYLEVDRDGFSGRPLFRGMNDVLDEYGITDREERKRIRQLWRDMHAAEREVHEEQEATRKEAEARKQASTGKKGRLPKTIKEAEALDG